MRFSKLIGIFFILVLGIICASDTLPNGWMPNWKVGDWWTIKTKSAYRIINSSQKPSDIDTFQPYEIYYKVIGVENIKGSDCFAVEQRRLPIDESFPEKRNVYYFRKSNLQIVRITDYSYEGGKLREPYSVDYKYDYKVPFISTNLDLNVFPSFPLVYEGDETESLAIKRFDLQNSLVTQTVTILEIEEFNEMTEAVDKIFASQKDCYHVQIEQWYPDSVRSSLKILDFRGIWIPSLPWFLYCERIRPENGKFIPLLESWLADYSEWHKKE
jgi:hypothetical protein